MSASPVMNVMVKAARRAGRALVRDFGEVEQLQISKKGPADFVTAADLKAEKTLKEDLSKARPGYGFLMEEGGEEVGTDKSHRWIVDPIDGTTNFVHGLAQFAISIALERDGQLVAGVVYNPITDEMFTAEKGKGAYLNDQRRLRVSARTSLEESLIATGIPFKGKPGFDQFARELDAMMPLVAGIRRFGSAALDLAFVAAGRFDGFWERDLKPWDMAAGIVLVREAGGIVQDLDGQSEMLTKGTILAAAGGLTRPLGAVLSGLSKE
ncbi:MAG: inositol monophosphatase family protein [Alphaproteobacteria bacterium]